MRTKLRNIDRGSGDAGIGQSAKVYRQGASFAGRCRVTPGVHNVGSVERRTLQIEFRAIESCVSSDSLIAIGCANKPEKRLVGPAQLQIRTTYPDRNGKSVGECTIVDLGVARQKISHFEVSKANVQPSRPTAAEECNNRCRDGNCGQGVVVNHWLEVARIRQRSWESVGKPQQRPVNQSDDLGEHVHNGIASRRDCYRARCRDVIQDQLFGIRHGDNPVIAQRGDRTTQRFDRHAEMIDDIEPFSTRHIPSIGQAQNKRRDSLSCGLRTEYEELLLCSQQSSC